MTDYKRNHYVPQWYQDRFLCTDLPEKKFRYLDLKPDCFLDPNGRKRTKTALRRWGPPRCFVEEDLYTTKFGNWESTEIEQKFFGKTDDSGRAAVEYFATFTHPSVNNDALHTLLPYMSIQKLRTPKGLAYLAELTKLNNKNSVLMKMQQLQHMHCALWSECVWSIADASQARTKFILSDHPVTVYNEDCFPASKWCAGHKDPGIWLSGTHTLFPLSLDKILILTNLSWVRNPYGNPLRERPNPQLFRGAVFNFTHIQTRRELNDVEVNEINYIIKQRAYRYIAAAKEEWLYPEEKIPTDYWRKLGNGYLLMPDPRSVSFTTESFFGFDDGRPAEGFDSYGRRPWQTDYKQQSQNDKEWRTFHAFKGEFARIFGPQRRGQGFEHGKRDKTEDSPDYHAYHLGLEKKFKPKNARKRGKKSW